jgi:hypothetical protein
MSWIVGKAAREIAGIHRRSLDPDPSQAYVLFPGTPYEHRCFRCILNSMLRNSASDGAAVPLTGDTAAPVPRMTC